LLTAADFNLRATERPHTGPKPMAAFDPIVLKNPGIRLFEKQAEMAL
jgi:hypothetical protein